MKTEIVVISKEELAQMLKQAISEALIGIKPVEAEPGNQIKGIKGLAEFLNVSHSHAQKIKNSGALPFFQIGKTILFDKAKVVEAMNKEGKVK